MEVWIKGRGNKPSKDFERGVSLLLNLCGYRVLHSGGDYEDASQKTRLTVYGRTLVGIDAIAFSHDNKEVLFCQCCSEWKDVKVSDILTTSTELKAHLAIVEDSPELYAVVVSCASKSIMHPSIFIPNEVKIVDIADLTTLLDEVKKGIVPYDLARKIFI